MGVISQLLALLPLFGSESEGLAFFDPNGEILEVDRGALAIFEKCLIDLVGLVAIDCPNLKLAVERLGSQSFSQALTIQSTKLANVFMKKGKPICVFLTRVGLSVINFCRVFYY